MKILIIGAGYIAREYLKTFEYLKIKTVGVLSRSELSSTKIQDEFAWIESYFGGESTLPSLIGRFDYFVIATPIESLLQYAAILLEKNKRNILIEKPAALSSEALSQFNKSYPECDNVKVALNRLTYPSMDYIRHKVGVEHITSVEFSFAEWVHRINTEQFSVKELARWGVSNCIHVIATVFNLIGLPKQLSSYTSGKNKIAWHENAAIFVGAGVSELGIPFSYSSDWTSAGRWSVTIKSEEGSYLLAPMEEVQFCRKGSLDYTKIDVPMYPTLKCGFIDMLKLWFDESDSEQLLSLKNLLPYIVCTETILAYEAAF